MSTDKQNTLARMAYERECERTTIAAKKCMINLFNQGVIDEKLNLTVRREKKRKTDP